MPFNFNHGYGRMIAESLASRRPHLGKVYFVIGSSQANWEEITEMFPPGPEGSTRVFGDLQAALNETEAGGDEVIFIAPGYTENITSAGDIDINNSQVTIIGLGEGSQRPTFTFTTAAGADLNVDAAGVTFENIIFDLTGVDALTGPLDINAAGCTFRKCQFILADSGGQAVVGIVTDANASDLLIEDCQFIGSNNAGVTSAIRLVGGDRLTIDRCYIDGFFKTSAGGIEVTTTAAGHVMVRDSVIRNRTASSTAAINMIVNTTMTVVGCVLGILSGSNPIRVAEAATGGGGNGSVLTGRNYYRNATAIAAGTLL